MILVYDSIMPWVLDIAHEKGLLGASFFTQSCSVCAVYYHIVQQKNSKNFCENGVVCDDSLPILGKNDMPCFSYFKESSYVVENLLIDQFLNIEKVDWIFFNSFDKLEDKVIKWMTTKWPTIKTIGPTFLYPYINNQHTNSNAKIDLFNPNSESCISWLNTKPNTSVIYVSFGSSVTIQQQQIQEIAYGLINTNHFFIWVVRESEEYKLPINFKSELSLAKGLIVQWSPQLEILDHKSVACFVTHCGWNSMLEGLSLGVPMIGFPQWVDQTTNAKFVEDVWEIGVRFKVGDDGIVGRNEVERCVKEVMGDERFDVLKGNALRWKALAEEAVSEGGSSYRNIQDFVSKVVSM